MTDRFLPGVPGDQIEAIFNAAPGNEIAAGKFDSRESSAALAANAFGYFLNRPEKLPALPGCQYLEWPAHSLELERTVRFPWRGGRHPVLDVLITTPDALIGIESKRYEPFRSKSEPSLSNAYWRDVWGQRMDGYQHIRDMLERNGRRFAHLDAAQLFKHALALRTQVNRTGENQGETPVLMYLYAEPETWPSTGEPVDKDALDTHREEIEEFTKVVENDEVIFIHCTYHNLLWGWENDRNLPADIRAHGKAVRKYLAPYYAKNS